MYNYYQSQQSRAPFLKGHPVSSIEEVRATLVDFDGSVFYFPDIANNRIYTKQINFDGTAQMNMYELKPIEQSISSDNYITRNEFNTAIEKLQAVISNQPTIIQQQQRQNNVNRKNQDQKEGNQ